MKKYNGPKILVLDLETAPILASVWSLWDQNVPLNMIEKDWHLLSYAAKWLESEDKKIVFGPHRKIMYKDQRNAKGIENDKTLLKELWELVNAADILLTQNGISFDYKKMNARFILNGLPPASPVKHIDTKRIASRVFAFTSNKLEYLTDKLCTKNKKLKHKKFPGFLLWKECLANNPAAWDELEEYNVADITSLEELYHVLQPWDNSAPNFNLYKDEGDPVVCNCGSDRLQRRGFSFTTTSKYQRYQCQDCGHWSRGKKNMITKDKRALLKGKA